jgi:pyrroloquinoline quinone biosynthesis protein B
LEDVLATVDFALVDATFFDGGELPGRDLSEIPHPFVVDTLARLERASPELLQRVVFTHLNHTNPLADPTSAAARQVRDARARVASEGQRYEL